MINLKSVYLETSYSWGASKYYNDGFLVSEVDIKLLKDWLDQQLTKFDKYQGKIFFHSMTEFPRYKFTEYVRSGAQKVRRVREPKNADAVVLDLKVCKQILESDLGRVKTYEHIGMYQGGTSPLYTETTKDPLKFSNIEKSVFLGTNTTLTLTALIELYNDYPNIKILDVLELNSTINTGSIMDNSSADDIGKLLKSSDNESIKLGMEMMTNYAIEESLLYIMILVSSYGSKMRGNSYWNSTSWSSYMNILQKYNISDYTFRYSTSVFDTVKLFLTTSKKKLLQQDIEFIKESILSEIKDSYNLENTGFALKLDKESITLNISPSDIIKTEEPEQELSM